MALALAPWLAALALAGPAWPLMAPLAALLAAAALGPEPGRGRPLGRAVLGAGLATVLAGPLLGPAPAALSGLVLALTARGGGLFRHPFLPAALAGLLAGLVAPGPQPGSCPPVWPALLPAALASLALGRQRPAAALLPFPLWILAALLGPSLGLGPADLPSLLPFWLGLAFCLGRQFWPTGRLAPPAVLVTVAGLAPVLGPGMRIPALALLCLAETALSLRARRAAGRLAASDGEGREWPEDPLLVAIRLCGREADDPAALYQGPPGCRLAATLDGGPQNCPQGCLSFGDCLAACPHGAMRPAGPGLPPRLDKARCRGCGACVPACPKGLMVLRPRTASFSVACRGAARLRDMDRLCPRGCLGCGRCRKACPSGAIGRLGLLAPPEADPDICRESLPGCGLACRRACPRSLPGPAMGRFDGEREAAQAPGAGVPDRPGQGR
jgi:ferredoxin